jgi:hypothetical protein
LGCVNDGIMDWKSEAGEYIENLKTNIISVANIKLELAHI